MSDALDEVFARFGRTGPEFGPGLSNHGPMATEALVALGREDAIGAWAEWYVTRLQEHPQARNPIDEGNWREALGEVGRAGDWIAYFDLRVREEPWRELLETWVARLGPGIMAGATHGILRTAHAVRALTAGETPERLREFAEGLGYWAARYQELPGIWSSPRSLGVADALPLVARMDASVSRRGMIFNVVKSVDADGFAPAINLVDVDVETGAFVSDVTRVFVRQYIANASTSAIAFVHTVTAPSALRILAPHLSADTRRALMAYAWQACAAVYSAYGMQAAPASLAEEAAFEFDEGDLIDEAVVARDEHAIKFTEACLREYRINPDPAFIVAAQDAVVRLRQPA